MLFSTDWLTKEDCEEAYPEFLAWLNFWESKRNAGHGDDRVYIFTPHESGWDDLSLYQKGFPITGLEAFEGKDDYFCFHAGTKFNEKGEIVTNGGRVLGVTAVGKDLKEARAKAYEATKWVNFDNKYMRTDIGKAIDEA